MRVRVRVSFLEILRRLALVVAFGSLSVFVGVCTYSWMHQKWESDEFDRTSPGLPEARKAPSESTRTAPSVNAGPLGRISVPRLHLTAMVEEGDDDDTLRAAVGHIPGTALPGAPGNFGLAGHRDTFFTGLKDLRRGDEIDFETRSAKYRYVVEETMIVGPNDTSVLAASRQKHLTLVTCYPFHFIGPAPRRFIARARQVGEIEKASPQARRPLASRAGNFHPK
jgi:sortase A